MKILIEFLGALAEKLGKKYLWVELEEKDIEIQDLFQKILPKILGKDLGEILYNLYLRREVIVVVNGVTVLDSSTKLNNGDKILIFAQTLASGG
jgi:molybdopterin converting factor small subunit